MLTGLSGCCAGLALLTVAGSFVGYSRGIKRWACGSLLLGAGFILIAGTGFVPLFLSVIVANTVIFASSTLYLHSIREFTETGDRPGIRAFTYALIVPFFLLFCYFTYIVPNIADRILVISTATAPLDFVCGADLLRRRPCPVSQGIIGTAFVLCGVGHVLRGLFVLIQGDTASNVLVPNGQQTAMFLWVFMTVLVFAFGFTLMCGEKFTADLRRIALTDPVTGSLNRAGIEAQAEQEVSRAVRTQTPLSVLILDLDHFKLVNDTHGHPVGDSVLRGVVDTARLQLRAYDLLGRFGGEEFLIVLPQTDTVAAAPVAERIRTAIAGSVLAPEQSSLRCTVSIGTATLTGGRTGDFPALMQQADAALYEAKRAGRNRVIAADDETVAADSKKGTPS